MWQFIPLLIGEFADYETGNVYFDRGDFAELLEFGYRYTNNDYWYADNFLRSELIYSGRHIMELAELVGFACVQRIHAMFGDDIVYRGLPDIGRSGSRLMVRSSFAITNNAEDKEGAWSFIRTIAMEDNQSMFGFGEFFFPINRTNFERTMNSSMRRSFHGINGPADYVLSQEAVDRFMELVNSITHTTFGDGYTPLRRIIYDSVSDFMDGSISAEDAARIIQSRASIYMSEHGF